jgi:hypothetical protein
MSPAKITINGREYDSPEEMPSDARHLYEDAMRQALPALRDQDGNGVPDLFEAGGSARARTFLSSRITVNGKTYMGVEEMPPEVRETYERVMASPASPGGPVKKNEFFFSFGISRGARPQSGATGSSTSAASQPLPSMASPIEPSGAQSRVQALLVFLAGAMAAGLAFWIFRAR